MKKNFDFSFQIFLLTSIYRKNFILFNQLINDCIGAKFAITRYFLN